MHAVVITVGIDPEKADEATVFLHNQVVPDVKATPGFVSGTWARSEDGTNGHSVVLFENEETAKAALAQAKQGPPGRRPREDPLRRGLRGACPSLIAARATGKAAPTGGCDEHRTRRDARAIFQRVLIVL